MYAITKILFCILSKSNGFHFPRSRTSLLRVDEESPAAKNKNKQNYRKDLLHVMHRQRERERET